jgi:hypothetical protein
LTEKALTVARKAKQAMTRRAVRNIVGGAQGNCSTGVVTKAKRNQTAELEESRTNSITTTGDFWSSVVRAARDVSSTQGGATSSAKLKREALKKSWQQALRSGAA